MQHTDRLLQTNHHQSIKRICPRASSCCCMDTIALRRLRGPWRRHVTITVLASSSVQAKPSGRVTVIVYSSSSSVGVCRALPGSSRKILGMVPDVPIKVSLRVSVKRRTPVATRRVIAKIERRRCLTVFRIAKRRLTRRVSAAAFT